MRSREALLRLHHMRDSSSRWVELSHEAKQAIEELFAAETPHASLQPIDTVVITEPPAIFTRRLEVLTETYRGLPSQASFLIADLPSSKPNVNFVVFCAPRGVPQETYRHDRDSFLNKVNAKMVLAGITSISAHHH